MPEKQLVRPKKTKLEKQKSNSIHQEQSVSTQKEEIISQLYTQKTKKTQISDEFKPFPTSDLDTTNSKKEKIIIKQPQKIQKDKEGSKTTVFEPFPTVTNSIAVKTSSISIKIENEAIKPLDDKLKQLEDAKEDPIEKIKCEFEILSPLEKNIIEIAKSILKKKKYEARLEAERVETMSPLIEQLYAKCISRLTYTKGISKESILTTIQGLIRKKWIVTNQRRTRKEILETQTLKKVLKFIHDYPGIHARSPMIEKELNITRNPFIKHVMVLEAFDLIRTKKIGRTQNYFIKNVPEIFDDFVVLFSNPLVTDILMILMKEKAGLSEMARRLNVYHGAIQYHIKNLIKMNLIVKENNTLNVNVELLTRYNALYKVPPFTLT